MLRAQLYTSAAGHTATAMQFNGMNGATLAEWTRGSHHIPDPKDGDNVYPEYVNIPCFYGMNMHAYKGDYIVSVQGEDCWFVLDQKNFLELYAAVGVWVTIEDKDPS